MDFDKELNKHISRGAPKATPDLLELLMKYREQEEAKAIPALENSKPYSIGDQEPMEAFKNAEFVYMLCDTKMGRPAPMEFDGERCIFVSIQPYIIPYPEYQSLICHQNNVTKENLFFVRYSQVNVFKQMRNFKCDHVKLIDENDTYRLYEYDFEDDDDEYEDEDE